jgi:hypothetical protein
MDIAALDAFTLAMRVLLVGVQTDDFRTGLCGLDKQRKRAGTAAQVKDPMTLLNACVLYQAPFEGIFSQQPSQRRVIERCEPAKPERGDVVIPLGDHCFSLFHTP